VLAVQGLELRVGARLLMEDVSFRVADGDKIGLVGRNGAGKTTLTKVLAGDLLPTAGKVDRSGDLEDNDAPPRLFDRPFERAWTVGVEVSDANNPTAAATFGLRPAFDGRFRAGAERQNRRPQAD